jgi:hypothetical protein
LVFCGKKTIVLSEEKKGPGNGPFFSKLSALHILLIIVLLAGAAALIVLVLLSLLTLLLTGLLTRFLLLLVFLLLLILLARLVVLVGHVILRGWGFPQPFARTGFASPWFLWNP